MTTSFKDCLVLLRSQRTEATKLESLSTLSSRTSLLLLRSSIQLSIPKLVRRSSDISIVSILEKYEVREIVMSKVTYPHKSMLSVLFGFSATRETQKLSEKRTASLLHHG